MKLFTINHAFACAIINNDWSGLEDQDCVQLESFLVNHRGYFVLHGTEYSNDDLRKCSVTGQMGTCIELALIENP